MSLSTYMYVPWITPPVRYSLTAHIFINGSDDQVSSIIHFNFISERGSKSMTLSSCPVYNSTSVSSGIRQSVTGRRWWWLTRCVCNNPVLPVSQR